MLGEQAEQLVLDAAAVDVELAHPVVALGDLLLRRAAVDADFGNARGRLQFQAADALHEEFVEIGAGDRQELDALEQRIVRGLGLRQDAAIELEPGELAIQVKAGIFEILAVPRRLGWGRAGDG